MSTTAIAESQKSSLKAINAKIFGYQVVKPLPSEWTESRIILPESTTKFPGPFRYRLTPYCVEIVNHIHPKTATRYVAVMKSSQCGVTAGVIIPAICYKISQVGGPILFTAADKIMAGRTIQERLDPILRSSRLDHLIRPNAIKRHNSTTGDTKFSKEYAGGTLTAAGTSNADTFRMFSAEVIFADDFDTAPGEIGTAGDVTKVMEGRQKMYGDSALTYYVSTPTVTSTSQIYKLYKRGSQKKWHWRCPACGEYFPVEFRVELEGGAKAGLMYELDDKHKLIPESIHYKTQCCGHKILHEEKFELNLTGKFIATNPEAEEFFESYSLNDLILPPGWDDWHKIVKEWIEANPWGQKPNILKLKAFNNERLGMPFEEMGETPKVTELMQNRRAYHPGTIPDIMSETDGNGPFVLLSLSCDLNGQMKDGIEDVRLDWEILAHSASGPTYSVDQGSIGTFKRSRHKTRDDKENEDGRKKWTAMPGQVNSIWPELEKLITGSYKSQSGKTWEIMITAIDIGFEEKLCSQFILEMQAAGRKVFGVKGKVETTYRKSQRDTLPVKRSAEKPKQLYNIEVNQMKEDLAACMKLRDSDEGGCQPAGFMNFPDENSGKYTYNGYFIHYEGEKRSEVFDKSGESLGFRWDKKNSEVQNHFWDVRVYNNACPHIWLDLMRRYSPEYKDYTWEDYINDCTK